MGCKQSNLNNVTVPEINNIIIEHNEYNYIIYCNKCDILGKYKKIKHCDICNKCHGIKQYIYCKKCNICLDPHSDYDIIRHRKIHEE